VTHHTSIQVHDGRHTSDALADVLGAGGRVDEFIKESLGEEMVEDIDFHSESLDSSGALFDSAAALTLI
jgi:hypothetical protein